MFEHFRYSSSILLKKFLEPRALWTAFTWSCCHLSPLYIFLDISLYHHPRDYISLSVGLDSLFPVSRVLFLLGFLPHFWWIKSSGNYLRKDMWESFLFCFVICSLFVKLYALILPAYLTSSFAGYIFINTFYLTKNISSLPCLLRIFS